MIRSLSIQNYALIEQLDMDPSGKLNIITGETGAGKSIMLGAVGLLVGNRSDTKVLLNTEQKCVVEGVFDISSYKLAHLFEANDLDYDDECIIRREISPGGKSRAFVNDIPVSLPVLKALGDRLLDVHSQHESLQLKEKLYQLEVLDAFAVHPHLIERYKDRYSTFTTSKKALDHLLNMQAQSTEDSDYKQFILSELQQAPLDDLQQEVLEQELEVLEHAEDIKLRIVASQRLLDSDEISVLHLLNELKGQLSPIAKFSTDLGQLTERVESQRLELVDVIREMSRLEETIEHNPEKIQEIKDRLDLLYRLQKKHNVREVSDLIALRDGLQQELSVTKNLGAEINKAQKAFDQAKSELMEAGKLMKESRQLAALDMATEVEKIIHKIGIENGRVEVKVLDAEPSVHGIDTVDILFSANKGIAPQEVSQVASGGEFSRLIFAIKYLIADKTAMPTVIFDEIDTGVSGEVAIQMVAMMRQMAKNHQVIAISHLPQFAAGGDAHYFVFKDHSSDRSVSKIRKLEQEDRVSEIAKMIGGKQPSEAAYSSAKELLGFT